MSGGPGAGGFGPPPPSTDFVGEGLRGGGGGAGGFAGLSVMCSPRHQGHSPGRSLYADRRYGDRKSGEQPAELLGVVVGVVLHVPRQAAPDLVQRRWLVGLDVVAQQDPCVDSPPPTVRQQDDRAGDDDDR